MSELVPEQRPDKNGHLVTRWVKPTQQGGGAKAIPAPAAYAVSEKTIASLDKILSDYYMDDDNVAGVLRENLKKMGPYAEAFVDGMDKHAGASTLFYDIATVTKWVYGPESIVKEQYRGTVITNFMSIIPPYHEGKDEEGVEAAHFAAIVFNGIDGYNATDPYTEDEKTAFTVAAAVTEYIRPLTGDDRGLESMGFHSRNHHVELLDRRSVDILLENVDTADLLGAELMKRGTFNAGVLEEIIKHGVLRDGSL